jgi:hypothetical protein
MDGARRRARPALPQTIDNPKTKKQKLYNDVIAFLSAKGLKCRGDEVCGAYFTPLTRSLPLKDNS